MSETRRDLFNPGWEAERAARAILDAAISVHEPTHVFALFSGGHDSLCSTHIASQHARFSGVVTLFTGIGVKATRRYVYETCKWFGWPLRVYRPRKGNRYHEMVEQYGFPGKAQHRAAYIRLKERQVDRLVAEHKTRRHDRILLVTGVRAAESTRRMGRVAPIQRDGAQVWVAPIIDWLHEDKGAYMARHRLPTNEVVELLHRSGECNCGSFAQPGELEELRLWYPDDAEKIDLLRERIRDRFAWGWGENPPEKAYPADDCQIEMRLCTSCEGRAA